MRDQVGTIYKVYDHRNHQVADARVYDSFGNLVSQSGTTKTPLGFQGKYYDSESGLNYFYHRYYNPALGRFISEDPIGLSGGLNLNSFVENNPINLEDPFGTQWTPSEFWNIFRQTIQADTKNIQMIIPIIQKYDADECQKCIAECTARGTLRAVNIHMIIDIIFHLITPKKVILPAWIISLKNSYLVKEIISSFDECKKECIEMKKCCGK
ncbi:MAG: RHS repeat-associated core domain-containing protein [Bacteroidota bacterium]